MNFYLERIQGLCNVNVISAAQGDHKVYVMRAGKYLEPDYGVYIVHEGDVVYSPVTNEPIYITQTAGQDGCLDHLWTVAPNGCPIAGTHSDGPALYWNNRELHGVAKALYIDDILATTVLVDCDWNVHESIYALKAAFRSNGNAPEWYDDIPAPESLHRPD